MTDNDFKTGIKTQGSNLPDLASQFFGAQAIEAPSNHWLAVQNEQALQPVGQMLPSTIHQSMLIEHQQIETLRRTYHLPIRLIGLAPVFEDVRIYQGLDSKWVLSPVENDRLYQYYGNKLPAPKWVKTEIVNPMVASGLDPRPYSGHQLPPNADDLRPGQSVPIEWLLPPQPATLARRTRMLATAGSSWWRGVREVLKMTAVASLAVTAGAAAISAGVVGGAMAVPLALAAGVDPCLLGVFCNDSWIVDGRPIGMWYYICHWFWPEEEK